MAAPAFPQAPAAPGYQLAEGVHTVGTLRRPLLHGGNSRAYLFEEGDRLTLVDTLFDNDARVIIDYLWSIGRSPSDVTDIVLTHSHRSHIGGVAAMRALSNAPVSCHASEAAVVEGHAHLPPVKLRPLRPPQLIPFRVLSHLHRPKHKPCLVDCTIDEGSTFGTQLKVFHVPGHTDGSLALSWRDEDILVVADAVLTWPSFGAGWVGFNVDDVLFRKSLRRLVDMKPRILAPGHGFPISENTTAHLATLITR